MHRRSADRECDDDDGPSESLPSLNAGGVGVEVEYPDGATEKKCRDGTKGRLPFSALCRPPVRLPGTGFGFGTALQVATVSALQKWHDS